MTITGSYTAWLIQHTSLWLSLVVIIDTVHSLTTITGSDTAWWIQSMVRLLSPSNYKAWIGCNVPSNLISFHDNISMWPMSLLAVPVWDTATATQLQQSNTILANSIATGLSQCWRVYFVWLVGLSVLGQLTQLFRHSWPVFPYNRKCATYVLHVWYMWAMFLYKYLVTENVIIMISSYIY